MDGVGFYYLTDPTCRAHMRKIPTSSQARFCQTVETSDTVERLEQENSNLKRDLGEARLAQATIGMQDLRISDAAPGKENVIWVYGMEGGGR